MSRYLAGIIILIVFISSCSIFRRPVNYQKNFAEGDSLKNLVQKNYFKYDWFSAKAKITIINNQGRTDFNASIRSKRDSAIWVSITVALGIEVARVMMTKDSVKVIDRFHKKYTVYDYSLFKNYTSIPITLNTLEDIIAGIPIYFDIKKVKQQMKDTTMMLTSSKKKIKNTLYLNSDYTILKMDLIDSVMGKSMNLKYKEYNRDNARPFALERELDLNDPEKTNVFISFSKVKINGPLKFPFAVKYD